MPDSELNEPEVSLIETIERLSSMLLRHRWCILTSLFVVTLLGVAIIVNLPNRYTSEATLVIVQQQVSERLVPSFSPTDLTAEIDAITREVLSRRRLMEVIDSFGLYAHEKQRLNPEQIVDLMRKDVSIDPIGQQGGGGRKEVTAFQIAYTSGSPKLAHDVTNRLTALFIEEKLGAQESQAAVTTKFMSEQVQAAKRRLDEQEQRLSAFKMNNLGTLPEQQQANLSALTDLRIQLQNVAAALGRLQQQKSFLESSLNGHIARLQTERTTLLARFTPQHPEVIKKDQAIDRASSLLARLKTGAPDTASASGTMDDPVVAQLRGQVEAILTEISTAPREEQRLRTEIAQYQGRINLSPVREQQLAALTRDYELYKKDYTSLLDKQLGSQMSASLEQKQQGQTFRLIDPPTMPSRPSSPKRLRLGASAAAVGLLFGVFLAFVRDLFDQSYHGVKELRHHLRVPLVVGIPMLLTPSEERRRKWKIFGEWVAGTVMMLLIAAAELYVLKGS